MTWIIDIETNGLLRPNEPEQCTKVHCIVGRPFENVAQGLAYSWCDDEALVPDHMHNRGTVSEGVQWIDMPEPL